MNPEPLCHELTVITATAQNLADKKSYDLIFVFSYFDAIFLAASRQGSIYSGQK